MNRRPIDTLALWYSLKPEIQALVGATAIAAELSLQGSLATAENIPMHLPISERSYWLGESDRFEKAADLCSGVLQDLIAENMVEAYADDGMPRHVDLNPLGIRQCTACGCTDDDACQGGCGWASATLCSTCAPKAGPAPETPHAA